MSEVKVNRKIGCDLLLELYVRRIDSRVSVILAKYADRGAERNSARRRHRLDAGPSGWLRGGTKAGEGEGGVTKYTELLDAVVSNRSYLRQHVLTSVKDAITSSQYGPARL